MPNPYIDNIQRWQDLSEVDYLGQFVKAWLAFNAWYRNAYTYRTDRAIIEDLKWQPNVVRDKIVPLISSSAEDGERFRSVIGTLHHRLENNHLHSGKGAEKIRITLNEVYLKPNTVTTQSTRKNGISYLIEPGTINNQTSIMCTVTNRNGAQILNMNQNKYDLGELENCSDFVNKLNSTQQGYLKALYRNVNPRLVVDLTNRGLPPIQAGTYQFTCTPEDLFAGVCEVIYLMRNTLFHGELVPSREAAACYEPAYQIVRTFLFNIS